MEEALDTLDGTDLDGAREYYYLREVVFDCAFNKKTKQLPSAGIMLYATRCTCTRKVVLSNNTAKLALPDQASHVRSLACLCATSFAVASNQALPRPVACRASGCPPC